MKILLRGMLFLLALGIGSSFFHLRCVACYNDVTTEAYAHMAKEIVEQSVQE